jgi:membrane protease YdiL (CAAX protease family)
VSKFNTAVIFFAATLGIYALVLYLFPNLVLWIPSYVYHIVILGFPLVLLVSGSETPLTLGLRWGNWKLGLPAALAVIVISFLVWWFLNSRFTVPPIDHILFSTIIWGPAAEEILFRGYLQPKLETRTGKWVGLVITSLLFGIAHLPKIFLRQAAEPPLVPEAFILEFVFGLIRNRTGSIYYGMLCHMAYNLIVTVV